jgi:hypothetical protein
LPIRCYRFRFPSFARIDFEEFCRLVTVGFVFQALPDSILKNFADSLLQVSFSKLCRNRFWRVLPIRLIYLKFAVVVPSAKNPI